MNVVEQWGEKPVKKGNENKLKEMTFFISVYFNIYISMNYTYCLYVRIKSIKVVFSFFVFCHL